MVVIKNGKKYYTLEEAKILSDKAIEEDAKKFAKKVILMQKEKKQHNQLQYV